MPLPSPMHEGSNNLQIPSPDHTCRSGHACNNVTTWKTMMLNNNHETTMRGVNDAITIANCINAQPSVIVLVNFLCLLSRSRLISLILCSDFFSVCREEKSLSVIAFFVFFLDAQPSPGSAEPGRMPIQ